MNYTVRRKVGIENAQGETILEHTYEDGFLIWQQYDAIYGPNATPAPAPVVPDMPPTVAGTDTPTLRMSPIALQTPAVEPAVAEVPAG